MLIVRSFKEEYRNIKILIIRSIQGIVIIVLLGCVYLQIGYTQESIQSRVGILFFIIINVLFPTMSHNLTTMPLEYKIIKREIMAQTYNCVIYYIARYISILPFDIIYYTVLNTSIYYMVGLQPSAGRWITFMLFIYSLVMLGNAMGFSIGITPECCIF